MPRRVIISGNVHHRIRQYISHIITTPDKKYQVSYTRALEKWNELISAINTKLSSDIMRFPPTQQNMLGKSMGCHQFNYKMKKSGTQFLFGLIEDDYLVFDDEYINEYRNTGGFDIIGSGRTKLEKEAQFESGIEILRKLNIKALVIIGGDDSNTNACVLAEYYAAKKYGVQVIGCPKTIDGDLKNEQIETSFGFDTACKTYSELVGNIQRDCNSARKYWHFIKVMGRSASHIALECALQTQPNICLVSEEVEAKQMSLDDVVEYIAKAVAVRAADGNNFGTVIIPEGLEFIGESAFSGCTALQDIYFGPDR